MSSPVLKDFFVSHSASFSWMCAESMSITDERSAVAAVVMILPLNPFSTSRGMRPEWSI